MVWDVEQLQDQWGIRGECLTDVPLAPLTTWRIGGSADLLIRPLDMEDVHAVFTFLRHHRLAWVLLGGGSNVLVADQGIREVVIQLTDMDTITPFGPCKLRVGAGCRLSHLVNETVRQGYGGFESLAGIPGTVGAAVAGNSGALGQQVGDCVLFAQVAETAAVERWSAEEFAFDYRSSAITTDYAILEVVFQCERSESAVLQQRVRQARQHRSQAHAVGGANAGSVFKNPPGHKAWQLITECGLQGEGIGGAQISAHHANFIINTGVATAYDVISLIALVQRIVKDKCGVELELEVHLLGDFCGQLQSGWLIRD